VTVGSFVAFWPYIMSTTEIRLLSAAFVVVVLLSRYLNIFSAIHSVQRPTWGEAWFAVVVGLLTFYAKDAHIYTAALLVMSLADGFAAIIGTRFGNGNRYRVFGSTKSIVGTLTFFIITCLILFTYVATGEGHIPSAVIPLIALVATLVENVGVQGIDNLFVPLFVAVCLSSFV
jgi:dolichol kinase